MNAPTPILIARSYSDLVAGVGLRVKQLRAAGAAGLATGYMGTALRRASFDARLASLRLCVIVAVDPSRPVQITNTRKASARDAAAVVAERQRLREGREILVDYMRELQKRGRDRISAGIFRKRTVQQRRSQAISSGLRIACPVMIRPTIRKSTVTIFLMIEFGV